ncbi:Dat1p NDAI_0E00310 [Naumovozyma dairenensis CBS 421]|uniref:Oligo(A)/oligo(T)-binding protein n=1 Tax=Naumovozyma dairenensis (strain ATCC 10597 / BCRC 20456 / CBS 421 / NBRC 0211 / NRRL Y-12639) TaxID=1071378 RepID=G0WAS7_NAUDC|nr:hypothetical protein NDAI_0E00310 [Naumovozyma dairenensis CBS 421]CCD24847.1 hypothetical protein NDAI_0E00310 [Naumovozyma dairenensis CBS 421]
MAKTLAQGRKPGSGRKPGKGKTLKEGRKPGSGRRRKTIVTEQQDGDHNLENINIAHTHMNTITNTQIQTPLQSHVPLTLLSPSSIPTLPLAPLSPPKDNFEMKLTARDLETVDALRGLIQSSNGFRNSISLPPISMDNNGFNNDNNNHNVELHVMHDHIITRPKSVIPFISDHNSNNNNNNNNEQYQDQNHLLYPQTHFHTSMEAFKASRRTSINLIKTPSESYNNSIHNNNNDNTQTNNENTRMVMLRNTSSVNQTDNNHITVKQTVNVSTGNNKSSYHVTTTI